MQISTSDWKKYINKLRQLSDTAAEKMLEYVRKNGFSDTGALIEYAYALATKYGEGAAELACEMYDAVAELEGMLLPSAIPAQTATFNETAKAINGSLLQSESGQLLDSVVGRLVKQAAADTTLKNAIRDKAQWAWIPSGDTCSFCITLASRGWQTASNKVLKGNHAQHIHANCDCQFAIRFNSKSGVVGYDPEKYKEMYYGADGRKPRDKINAMRRAYYAENKDKINAQKRISYEKRNKKEYIVNDDIKKFNPYNNKPGTGKLLFENGTTPEELRDRETATWLHTLFGGNIKCLPEVSETGKNVDAIWDDDYWEFKAPTTKNAIDDRLRKANSQILEVQARENVIGNRSGVVLDISNAKISKTEAIDTIINRANSRLPNNTDVIIRSGDSVVYAFKVKK